VITAGYSFAPLIVLKTDEPFEYRLTVEIEDNLSWVIMVEQIKKSISPVKANSVLRSCGAAVLQLKRCCGK
jgi:hypothetical protein